MRQVVCAARPPSISVASFVFPCPLATSVLSRRQQANQVDAPHTSPPTLQAGRCSHMHAAGRRGEACCCGYSNADAPTVVSRQVSRGDAAYTASCKQLEASPLVLVRPTPAQASPHLPTRCSRKHAPPNHGCRPRAAHCCARPAAGAPTSVLRCRRPTPPSTRREYCTCPCCTGAGRPHSATPHMQNRTQTFTSRPPCR